MLSIETPPGPSCPCKSSALRTDERASDRLAFEEVEPVGLGETQTPSFSIRNYVFKSRSKDIATNWPFPHQFLQLCLNHGVRDQLPPFERPDSVRGWCCRKAAEPEQPVSCSGAENISAQFESLEIKYVGPVDVEPCNIKSKSCLRSDELVVGCSDQVEYSLSGKRKQTVDHGDISDDEVSEANGGTVSAVTNHDQIEGASNNISELHCSVQVTRSVSEASSDVEAAELHPVPSELEILRGVSEKKCRLIVKLGAITETNWTEDIVSTSSTVSDPMASKLCPVCKIFASTSNTTLNAHIDQCLSSDSDIKRAVTKIPKPKVKPRKKRLMVDIYATAPRCTLEDLDRRNGTNWASELTNLMAPTGEACTEIKRPKLSTVDTRNDEKPVETRDDGNGGAVYVDSNGIKLRILSKFIETPPVMSREHFKLKKHAKKINEGKNLLNNKKNLFASKYSKYTRVKPQTKKPSLFKPFKGEIQGAPEGYHHADTHLEKEKSPSEISNAPDQTKSSGSATLRHWVCSKRSDLPKKLNHKDIKNSENSVLATRNLLAVSNQPDISNSSVVKSHNFKFSRPTEDLTYSPKTKRVDFLSNNVQIMDNGTNPKSPVFNSKWSSKSTSTNGLMLKISRSSGTPISSPRSRREEIHISATQKPDNSCDTTMRSPESCHPSLKAKKSSSMKYVLFGRPSSLEVSKGDTGNKLSISKKFRKHRSIMWTGKQGESPSDVNGGLCRPIKHFGVDAARTNKTRRTHRSDLSESISRSTTEEIMDQKSQSSSHISESEGEDAGTMEKRKYNTLKWHPDVQCHDPELATSDMQVEALALVDVVTKPSMEKVVGDTVGSVPVISENLAPASNAKLDPGPSVDENVQFVYEGETHVEPPAEKLCDEQAVQYCNVNSDEVNSQSIQMAEEIGFREKGDPCAAQYRECQAVSVPVQECSACLTSHGDATLEIPQENSSITSIRITSGQDQNLAIDREPSESPVSTASTISSSTKDTEPLMRPTVHYNSGLAIPCDTSVDGTEGRNVERRIQEVKPFPLAQEPEKFSYDQPEKFSYDQPCCCLRRGSFSRESQLLRQNAMDGTMLPSRGKQMSNLYITASISSPFSSYPSSGTYAMATPILESPTESITTRASADFDVKAPTCIDFSSPSPSPRTQTQSTSNSVLRLMGKNLMVANKEESAQLSYPAPDNTSNTQCLPPEFASTGWECFSYPHNQLPGGSAVFGQAPPVVSHQIPLHSSNMRVGGFAGSLQAGLKKSKLDQQIHHKLNKKPNSPSACNMERTAASHQHLGKPVSSSQANLVKEVIVIDDSPEFEADLKCSVLNPAGVLPAIPGSNPMQQRPFSCFPSQSQFFSKDVTSGFKPYLNACPRDYANTMKRGKTCEGSDPLLPRSFVFQSPPTGHLSPPFYYSQTLR